MAKITNNPKVGKPRSKKVTIGVPLDAPPRKKSLIRHALEHDPYACVMIVLGTLTACGWVVFVVLPYFRNMSSVVYHTSGADLMATSCVDESMTARYDSDPSRGGSVYKSPVYFIDGGNGTVNFTIPDGGIVK